MGMGVVLALILLSIIGFAVAVQGSKGSIGSPSPAFLPVIHPSGETPSPVHNGESGGSSTPSSPSDPVGFVISPSPATLPVNPSPSETPGLLPTRDSWRSIAPSSPAVPNGSFLHPPVTSPPPTSAPTPQKIKGIEPSTSPSPSPSTITLSPPYKAVPSPSSVQGDAPPSVQPSPPQRKAPAVRPSPVSTPTAPAPIAIPSGNLPKNSPVSQPTEHGSLPPKVDKRNANKIHTPESVAPAPVPITSTNLPKISPVGHPAEHGSLPPNVHSGGANKGHTPEPISPAPVAVNFPKSSPVSQPTEHGSLPPTVHRRNSNMDHTLHPVSQAPVAAPVILPKTSPVSQPTHHGSFPPNVHKRTAHNGHPQEPVSPQSIASPPWKTENSPPVGHPIFPKITPSILPAPVTSPTSAFPVNPPLVHPVIPAVSPSKLPGSIGSPSPAFLPVIHPSGETPGPVHHGESGGSSAPSTPSDPVGFVISPSPATLPVDPSPSETPGLLPTRHSWRSIAPSSPAVPNGSFLHPPVTSPPPTSAPTSQKIKGIEPSISPSPSPSTITLSPPYKAFPSPSSVQGDAPPSIQPSPPQRKTPAVRPSPVSTPTAPAPVAIPSGNLPKNSPVSQPTEHGSLPPKADKRNANKIHTPESGSPAPVPIISTNLPKISPVGHPAEHGSLPPNVRSGGANKGHTPEPISPAPVAVNFPKSSPVSQPTEHGSLPPTVHRRNSNMDHTLNPVSQAPVAAPVILPKTSPVSQPTHHGSFPPNVHKRTAHNGHPPEPVSPQSIASPRWKTENSPPVGHPIFPKMTPSILPAPVTSPTSAFPVNPPLVHPVIPAVSPSKLPEPVVSPALTPSRGFNWKKGGEPVSAPLYKTPKPLPAVVHSPAQAPAAHRARQFHHAPEPLISSPKSPFNKEYHSPASSPSSSFYKHHHTRNIITSPAPASSYLVSPPPSKHQDQPIPPSLLPTSGRRHHAPPPIKTGSSVSPFAFPILSPVSQVSPAPSPSFKLSPRPTKIPFLSPKVSPSGSSSKSPKTPVLPQVQALPPPPPNEDCLSTVCTEPYTNSPPGAPCRCVWPMQVGLHLGISLYTFFPLVSELASEIASGVFMKPSQVRIMGANAASQQPDKTIALIDLVPLGEGFDNTTAFLTSERFWHKQVVIKASYFGDYDVLYVSYPGLPPSPPLPPSSMIDGGPYSSDGNNGRTIKPLGVDIQKRQRKGGLSRGIIAIIALSVFLAVVLCTASAWVLFKCRGRISQPTSTPRVLPPSLTKAPGTAGSLVGGGLVSASSSFRSSIAAYTGSAKTFSMNDIEKATDNFHASRILGEGGFGCVYGGILEDGTKVAVKVLKREDHHGDREFLSEVEMLSRLHHRNLVKLIGICTEDSFRCLIYELIPNGSVESHLHGVDRENSPLDWSSRMKIALGAARGLAYLHEDSSPHVIHRDFKSSNILLEDDFTPKVSDFGLARTAADEENRHISTRVMGTFGYVAPEYAMTGHLLVKSDVYSYGVVLLELLTGRKPVDMSQPPGQENLVAWARPLLTSKEGLEAIIDPSLGTDVSFDSVAKVAAIASMCVQPEVSDRPFMGEVVQALKLVCTECDEAKEAGSRSSSQEDLSVDLDTVSGQLPDNFQRQFSATNYDSGIDIENGLSASELFSSSVRFGRQASGSFRRHSYSGPLRTGRSMRLWQIIRRLSGGSVSEHGTVFKL